MRNIVLVLSHYPGLGTKPLHSAKTVCNFGNEFTSLDLRSAGSLPTRMDFSFM